MAASPLSWYAAGMAALLSLGCGSQRGRKPENAYNPLAAALAERSVRNVEAGVPAPCYTKTAGVSNPCWVCHTEAAYPNLMGDIRLQKAYAFSEFALKNRWTNLFEDRAAAVSRISDAEILRYIRQDNYRPLRRALSGRDDYPGYVPDLDLARGFDAQGFARDGSGWRALRYKPFPGMFWPTNGSSDDVFIRLPGRFRRDEQGRPSDEVYRANLSILAAAMGAPHGTPDANLSRRVEPLNERAVGIDLDKDGHLRERVTRIIGLPRRYAGLAKDVAVRRWIHPAGTEYLHSVRYVDPDATDLRSARMKELRYARKIRELDRWAITAAYEKEASEKDEGLTPVYPGSAKVGLVSFLGWQLQGFIEDRRGRLRLQTEEEHRHCMGCHSGIGVTLDGVFSLPRKVPGPAGWRVQSLRGMPDVPQAGHPTPEVLTYLERVRGGDELRQNDEMLARFFRVGDAGIEVRRERVARAAPDGDRDLHWLLAPSRKRALQLAKAYRVLVMRQAFTGGRDATIRPVDNVHRSIENGSTELAAADKIHRDGRLTLAWP